MRNLSSELQRISNDLEKAKRKLAEYQTGDHMYGAASGIPADLAGKAHHATSRNLEINVIPQLELQYVQAMLADGGWSAAAIIEAMS